MSVLIVEDHPGSGPALAAILDLSSYRVTLVRSYATARAALREVPHILISDVRLPDGSGIDLIREAKSTIAGIFAVAVTADPASMIEAAARAAGADLFMQKPVDVATMLRALPSPRLASNVSVPLP